MLWKLFKYSNGNNRLDFKYFLDMTIILIACEKTFKKKKVYVNMY